MDNNKKYTEQFTKPIVRIGRFTNLFAIFTCLIPALVMWVKFGAFPGVGAIGKGWLMVLFGYFIIAVVESISYFPVLGLSGTYMGFLAGNIGNTRVPCSAMAQEALGVKTGTKKAEIVSTLAIAGSVITTTVVVFIAAIGGKVIMQIFPPKVLEAFNYVSPAIFGSVFGMNAVKNLRLGVFALITALIMLLGIKVIPPAFMILINVFATVVLGSYLYKKKKDSKLR